MIAGKHGLRLLNEEYTLGLIALVNREVAAPSVSMIEIARMIEQVPRLASRVLQTANSPLLGMRAVTNIREAVVNLGLLWIRSILVDEVVRHFVDCPLRIVLPVRAVELPEHAIRNYVKTVIGLHNYIFRLVYVGLPVKRLSFVRTEDGSVVLVFLGCLGGILAIVHTIYRIDLTKKGIAATEMQRRLLKEKLKTEKLIQLNYLARFHARYGIKERDIRALYPRVVRGRRIDL